MGAIRFILGGLVAAAFCLSPEAGAQTAGLQPSVPPPKLKKADRQRYANDPQALQNLLARLNRPQPAVVPGAQLAPNFAPAAQTWSFTTNQPPMAVHNPILLTDGTVIAHGAGCSTNWYKLTPDINGSYVSGTWSKIASLQASYSPLYFGSGVLPDGRVIIMGGEYNGTGCNGGRTTQGAIYDPVANTWTPVSPPAGWSSISDASGMVLANGTYLQTSCCDSPPKAALLNPSTLTWTATGTGKADIYDEESMALLPDGTVLTVDAYVGTGTCGTNSERYNPSTGVWTSAGSTGVQQADCSGVFKSYEVGPLVMRPDGKAISFSGRTNGTPQVAIFDTYTSTWSAGPVLPSVGGVQYTMPDAPAAVLPSGNILLAMSPGNWTAADSFFAPTHYFEFDIANSTFTQVGDMTYADTAASYTSNFLVLPTGQILGTQQGTVQIYTPAGSPQAGWAPAITSVPSTLAVGYSATLSGTQLNGLTEGAYYGDDSNASTHFPIVNIVNNATGHVSFARTTAHSSRSIASGATGSTQVTVLAGTESGASTLYVIANGIASAGSAVTIVNPVKAALLSPAAGSTLLTSSVTFSWDAGVGASQYRLSIGSTLGGTDILDQSTGTNLSQVVNGLPTTPKTIYVRLYTQFGIGWAQTDYTFNLVVGGSLAVMSAPASGSSFTSTAPTFNWNVGNAASEYWLSIGKSSTSISLLQPR